MQAWYLYLQKINHAITILQFYMTSLVFLIIYNYMLIIQFYVERRKDFKLITPLL